MRLDKDAMACNKPRRTPSHPTKSHVVKACEDGKEKIIHFGQQGVQGSPKKAGESESYRKRRLAFKARHAKNIAKGKMSAAYWANRVKWAEGGEVKLKDYADPFAEMSAGRKLLELLKGAGNAIAYGVTEPKAYAGHAAAPDMFAQMLRERYPELGAKRTDRGPLDAAINYAGAYDWAARPEVAPEDARNMAKRYQLLDYVLPGHTPSNEAADYAQNMAGVEQALADRIANTPRKPRDIVALARKYAADEAAAGRVPKFAEGGKYVDPIEAAVQKQFGMEPGLDRATFLPWAGRRSEGNLQWAVPAVLYDLAKAYVLPGEAAKGHRVTPEEAAQFAGNVMSGGLAASSAAPVAGTVAGMAVKGKGGNWVNDATKRLLRGIRPTGPTHRDEALMLGGHWTDFVDTPEGMAQVRRNAAMDDWINTKLDRYVRNEMATPQDPLIKLAERDVLHYEPRGGAVGAYVNRKMAGTPPLPQSRSPLAQAWEDASDAAVNAAAPYTHQIDLDFPDISQSEALAQLGGKYAVENPEALAHSINRGVTAETLGFRHLTDELRNAITAGSELPAELQLTPDKLSKVSVPQAVELVSKINAYRAANAAKAEREGMLANLQASPRLADEGLKLDFVDKPGGTWIEIPETSDRKGMQLCTSVGKAGGWCTQGESAAQSYGSGEHRLTALVDAEGRPHVQAKITENEWPVSGEGFTRLDAQTKAKYGQYVREWRRRNPEVEELTDENVIHALKEAGVQGPAPDITELKPVGNSFSSERAREYLKRDPSYRMKMTDSVVKFLNSGDWGKVKDLHHYGIVDTKDPRSVIDAFKSLYGDKADLGAVNDALETAQGQVPRFISRPDLRKMTEPFVEGQGYAAGGSVRAYDPDLIQRLSDQLLEA
jgi:hypothetical protein